MQEQLPYPPPDKLGRWEDDLEYGRENVDITLISAWQEGFQSGADAELEACCEWLEKGPYDFSVAASDLTGSLRAARRPKPPSLKEQALRALLHMDQGQHNERALIIRRALESIPD